MKEVVHMADLHADHKLWKNELEFYRDEIKTYNHRLEELVVRYTKKDMLAELEHFQNAFIRQNEIIDTMIHNINEHETELVKIAKENPVANHNIRFEPHTEHEDNVLTQRKIYNELKTDFTNFLRKYM